MFYPVKIKDAKGKVKKVLPSKKLSKDYWDSYFGGLQKRVPLHLKKKGKGGTHVEIGAGNGRKPLAGDETLQEKVGERIYSRLVEMCRLVKLKGDDYRMVMEDKAAAPPRPAKRRS